ncbi:CBN-LGC-31 protein, partial [Aphelenchoides avenae]
MKSISYWQDEFLRWSPDQYEGATEIFLSSGDIWIPEFSLYYSLNFNDAVKLMSNNDVRVNYTGHIRYYLPFSTESLCNSVDVKFFPFDIQQCTLLFGSWAHSNDSIKYSLYSKNLSLIDFYNSEEWHLDPTRSHIMSEGFLYDYLEPPLFWEMIVIDLVLVRQSFYYVFNLVIPSAIITLVAIIGFHTPGTSGKLRDSKFRLGIMTLMSMSMILLAIVEDMPKFSMAGNKKGRGSSSGIPLIGLYYFMLLAIVGMSTVTTSMFVYLEREVRTKHKIPWYLCWAACEMDTRKIRRTFSYRRPPGEEPSVTDALLSSTEHGHLNGFVGTGTATIRRPRDRSYAQSVALSLLKLIPNNNREQEPQAAETANNYEDTIANPGAESSPSPRKTLRKRLSLVQYDNLVTHQFFNQLVDEVATSINRLEKSVTGVRRDLVTLLPRDELNTKWQKVIRRLELISLAFYFSLLFMSLFLFFYHD